MLFLYSITPNSNPLPHLRLLSLLLACSFLFFGCEENFELPALSDFDKSEREALGESLLKAYLGRAETTLLPRTGTYAPVYAYVDALYAQASNEYRRDNQSVDPWTPGRAWTVTITQSEAATLLAFPGGNVVMSTGLLRQLNREYELYHLLALEATLVHEGFILEQLVDDYGLESLELIANADAPEALSVFQNLAAAYPTLALSPARLQAADRLAQALICRTSLYAPYGTLPLIEKFGEAAYFLARPGYGGRAAALANFSADCGTLETNGGYASEVLAHL